MSYVMTPPWVVRRRMMVMAARKGRRGWGPGGGYPAPRSFDAGRPRVSRGDVRSAILHLLAEEPMHGYQIMQEISDRTGGIWQPSPGSVYPTLQQLEDEDLVRAEEQDGKKTYTLTDAGRAKVESEGAPPWERFGGDAHDAIHALREAGFQVGAAVMHVARAGSEAQVNRAKQILENARREIYKILAEDDQVTD